MSNHPSSFNRVRRWRRAVVTGALTTSLALAGFMVVPTETTSTTSTTSVIATTGTSSTETSSTSGVSGGSSSSSSDATTSGS